MPRPPMLHTTNGVLCEGLLLTKQWPAACPDLRAVVEAYTAKPRELGELFLRLVAAVRRIPEDVLFTFLSNQHRLKLVQYPLVSRCGDRCLVQAWACTKTPPAVSRRKLSGFLSASVKEYSRSEHWAQNRLSSRWWRWQVFEPRASHNN
jgi:hypothetical protein